MSSGNGFGDDGQTCIRFTVPFKPRIGDGHLIRRTLPTLEKPRSVF